MFEHVVAHIHHCFYGILCFTAVTLCFILGYLLFVVHIELEHIGFTTALDPVILSVNAKVQADQHVLGIGLVHKVVLADVAESLSV